MGNSFTSKRILLILAACFGLAVILIVPIINHSGLKQAVQLAPGVLYENQVIVLMYHDMRPTDDQSSKVYVTTTQFREHLDMLRDNKFNIISVEQLEDFALGKKPVPPNAVVLTFDDGYDSFYHHAFPILQEYKAPATMFIVGVSSDIFNPVILPHLTWDQMREMKPNGHSFYSHTYDSHYYAAINKEGKQGPALKYPLLLKRTGKVETKSEYRSRITSDLELLNKRLEEELGNDRKMIAFPYGAYNETVMAVTEELGMNLKFTTQPGMNKPGNTLIYRINAGAPDITAEQLYGKMEQQFQ